MTIETSDYSIFKKHESNRVINELALRKLINSIKSKNMLELRPILVDSQMRVIDGQHRLEAAKALRVPIFYLMKKESESLDIILLNTQKRWSIEDYLNFFAFYYF